MSERLKLWSGFVTADLRQALARRGWHHNRGRNWTAGGGDGETEEEYGFCDREELSWYLQWEPKRTNSKPWHAAAQAASKAYTATAAAYMAASTPGLKGSFYGNVVPPWWVTGAPSGKLDTITDEQRQDMEAWNDAYILPTLEEQPIVSCTVYDPYDNSGAAAATDRLVMKAKIAEAARLAAKAGGKPLVAFVQQTGAGFWDLEQFEQDQLRPVAESGAGICIWTHMGWALNLACAATYPTEHPAAKKQAEFRAMLGIEAYGRWGMKPPAEDQWPAARPELDLWEEGRIMEAYRRFEGLLDGGT